MWRLILLFLILACDSQEEQPIKKEVKVERAKVKVAAIQCYSEMGELEKNRQRLTRLIRDAASKKAKIIVLPEAAISGYMEPDQDITWTTGEPGDEELAVQSVAELVDGESVRYFSQLAAELKIYLTIPFIEKDGDNFYNSVVLAGPTGKVLAHHRKQDLWKHGDSSWCTEGELPAQVVETEYGRLGLMICYDVHSMPAKLASKKADIVLYSVGWYGPNTEDWYRNRFPRTVVVPHKFSVVAANWSHLKGTEGWQGCGWSNVTYKNGVVLKISSKVSGEALVLADLFLE